MAIELRTRLAPGRAAEGEELAYPADREQAVEVGGDRFILRPIRPEDLHAYSDFIARMDESDLRRRFVRPEGSAPESDLPRDTQIDNEREMAFVAVRQSESGGEEIVGEVCAYRYPAGSTAELAIIVRSDMKGHGLGRALMEKMIEYCRANELELIAQILPENTAMIRLAERCGMQMEHPPGSDLVIAHIA